jgi:hypothetical protein
MRLEQPGRWVRLLATCLFRIDPEHAKAPPIVQHRCRRRRIGASSSVAVDAALFLRLSSPATPAPIARAMAANPILPRPFEGAAPQSARVDVVTHFHPRPVRHGSAPRRPRSPPALARCLQAALGNEWGREHRAVLKEYLANHDFESACTPPALTCMSGCTIGP